MRNGFQNKHTNSKIPSLKHVVLISLSIIILWEVSSSFAKPTALTLADKFHQAPMVMKNMRDQFVLDIENTKELLIILTQDLSQSEIGEVSVLALAYKSLDSIFNTFSNVKDNVLQKLLFK